ncbi:hypothetical protein B7P34_17760 [Streptosporangium nondiastaticum]|uniref:Di-trans,poly-cis-decaprenylcistransferase n=1 Tax=Streptosporangium nondiastaticum TaxID=35764 RepID=A0A9X7PGT8_9ACTN|nr:undecaprenyl diphosphate synthase family protein [Streptosporangium nondiastaticum]PSJ27445.1 hypothetical protein B7P34_17760 [Streptosporangium nondiastaticum]
MDGNRRWARARGLDPVDGHREGALRLGEVCEWAAEAAVETLTLWVLSTDNLNIAIAYDGRREIAHALRRILLTGVAPPADGDPVDDWQLLIAKHLYTPDQPDPDLIIRTSGEQRLSGFLLWQAAVSEYYFCEAPWPAFSRDEFRSALDSYASRHRRYGH